MARNVWMRLGVTLNGTDEEIEDLFGDDYEKSKRALYDILDERRFKICGNSYIPECEVEEYNATYETEHEVCDYEFEL